MSTVGLCVFCAFLFVGIVSPLKTAVFEHAQQSYINSSYTPENIVRENLEYYRRAAQFAASKGVQIIVFPEYGIFPPIGGRQTMKRYLEYVPDPKATFANPCLDPDSYKVNRPILYTLSCLSRNTRLIIVANMGDIQPCEGKQGCPKDGAYQFNTNVVFDRDGRILARYHKEHLFDESGMDVPPPGQDLTFDTHLGRFATFVCFDIVFGRAAQVSRLQDVRAVLFPTMWINNSPLFNAPQYFESWAVGNNVTLLAANVHLPGKGSLGSVIVQGLKGALVYSFNPDGHSKLLMADLEYNECSPDPQSSIYILTKDGFQEWINDGKDVESVCSTKVLDPAKDLYKDYRCSERDTSNFTLKRLAAPKGHLEACNGGVCCTLEYATNGLLGDFYFGVFNGTYNAINRYFFAEEDCFLAKCDELKGNNKTCITFPMRSDTLFRRIRMQANFSTDFIYPSVVESGMRLTPKDLWKFEKSADGKATISLDDDSGRPLLTVGFKARPYSRDPPYVN